MSEPRRAKFPWENRLGVKGETEVESRLLDFSIPRRLDKDVGIDFYCELLRDDSFLMPFYVQAKGTEHFDENWGASIKKSTILYWLEQPFPVFLIVYDDATRNCYWMSVEDRRYSLYKKIFKTDGKTIYLEVDKSHVLERERNGNDEFIKKIRTDFISIEQFQGRSPFKGDGYVKTIPSPPRSKIELMRTKENVRGGLYSLSRFYLLKGDLKNAHILCDFLTKFDKTHYNHFVWLGQIEKALGRKAEAKGSFEKALEICERDKDWEREDMKKIIAQIKKEMADCPDST